MEDFKIGSRVACKNDYGYRTVWDAPEVIVRETKSCWITDKGTQVRKDTHCPRGGRDAFERHQYYLWTDEMEIKKQRVLLKATLEQEVYAALHDHKFSITQLQYIKTMLEENSGDSN